jgi:hypothetical protein
LDDLPIDESLLIGSPEAKKRPYLVEGDKREFISSCPIGYFLIGFWGHGINSYAFYYSRVDDWSKIFFRLPYGGVYMDQELQAHLVRTFLSNFFFFEKRIKQNSKKFVAMDSMGVGDYTVTNNDGQTCNFRESLLRGLDFALRLRCSKAPRKSRGK